MTVVVEENIAIDFEMLCRTVEQTKLLSCQGKIVRVAGLTVESAGPTLGIGQLCGISMRHGRRVLAEVVGFNNENLVLLPLENISGICPGDIVTAREYQRHLKIDDSILGRVLNGLGQPIDGGIALSGQDSRSLDSQGPAPLSREKITQPLSFGIRAIDGLLTCGKGQRVG
ncbi:MAG: EscN/YscN/HrcN family type III secretion system ATPase, partial [Phycisphaerae bacterium]|nr:EscN/YscN/HrcN family type III secretion system ATPase [Phycisphaerae bacterium]